MTQPTVPLPDAQQPAQAQQPPAQPSQAQAQQPTQAQQQPQAPSQQQFAQQQAAARAQAPQAQQAPYAQAAPQHPVAPASGPSLTTLAYTNTYALLAIIFAFLSPIAGIIFGHLGLSQIKRTGDQGRGLALTGLILSYAYFAFLIIFIFVYVGFIFMMIGTIGSSMQGLEGFDDYSSSTPGF
ncbi:DUF4190 domain-containing protein [Leucobacter sp. CSA2]|uniref:DUF4190 domain-containing protein n=2 Tax=Leucobacter edaphi TaxID=2796472 RepID=A0A934QAW0_9MICO|nr:DUF4190 domain-containing protein [Leucobacter edaphi]